MQPVYGVIRTIPSIIEAKKWVADIGVPPERFRERGERRHAMRYVGAYTDRYITILLPLPQ